MTSTKDIGVFRSKNCKKKGAVHLCKNGWKYLRGQKDWVDDTNLMITCGTSQNKKNITVLINFNDNIECKLAKL